MKSVHLHRVSIIASGLALGLLSACAPPGWNRSAPPVPSEIDLAKMVEATQAALEGNKDGESTNWSVEGSTHLGTATPMRTFETDAGVPCRDFQQTVTVDGRTQAAYGTACRDAEGNWNETRYNGLGEVGPNDPSPAYDYPGYRYPPYGYGPRYRYGPRFGYGFGFGSGHGHYFRGHRHYRHFRRHDHRPYGRGRRHSSR